jgi:hypothetical protein
MKTIKSTKILLILITMLINSISYSYNVEVKSPKACYDNFSFVQYPADIINCKFKAYKVHPFDSDLITYKIYAAQNGYDFLLGSGEGIAEQEINYIAYYQNFPGFKYNEKASIRIDVKSFDTPLITYSGSGYFVAYREFVNSGNRAILNGNSQLVTPNPILITLFSTCGELASGTYSIKRTKVEFTLNGDFSDSIPEINPSLCLGFNGGGPNNQHYWGGVLSSSSTQFKFYTYTYNVYNILGQYFGNRPCDPSQAAIVYKMVGRPNISPVIGTLSAFPRTIYRNSNVSFVKCNLLRGSDSVQYFWRSSVNPVVPISLTPMGNKARLQVNFTGSNSFTDEDHIYICVKAMNQFGETNWDSIKIYINNSVFIAACPYINYANRNDTIPENSILSESYETPKTMVDGKLLLQNPSLEESKKMEFRLSETESDITEIDMIGITQVLVEPNEKVAVTREGEIVNFTDERGKLNILKNKTIDITDDLESDDGKYLKLEKDDIIDVDFIPDGSNFLVFITSDPRNKEKPVGKIITNEGDEYNLYSLDNPGSVCIKIESNSISSFSFRGLQEFGLNQIAVVKNLNTFSLNSLNLSSAILNDYKDITKLLSFSDNNNFKLSGKNYIDFHFDSKISDGNKKSYFICNSRGQINTVGERTSSFEKTDVNSVILNNLSNNLPNPFNPVTKISYQIAKDGFVKLNVFDIAGREVKTIVNEFKTAGSYETVFDGSGISSGTYFYRIETSNGFKDTKRMILIK